MQRFVFFPGAVYAGSGRWFANITVTRDERPAGVRMAEEPHATQAEALRHAIASAHTAAAGARGERLSDPAEFVVHVPAHTATVDQSTEAARKVAKDPERVRSVAAFARTALFFLPQRATVPA